MTDESELTTETRRPKVNLVLRILRRLGASDCWYWLTWNPVLRYGERMVHMHGDLQYRIMPEIKGKDIDASGMFSLFGWGVLWGSAVGKDEQGRTYCKWDKDHPFFKDRKFGHIRVKYLS